MDASDLKQFFETNYSQIYFIFYENFITLENSLKLKGKHFYLSLSLSLEYTGDSRYYIVLSHKFYIFKLSSQALRHHSGGLVDIFVSLECSLKQVLIEQQMAKGKIEGTHRRHEFQRDKLFKEQGRKIMQWTV